MEYITCIKCKKQQVKNNFWYCSMRHDTCKFCNKKTNVIPNSYNITCDDILLHLSKTIESEKLSIIAEMKFNHIFEFIKRQDCKNQELSKNN